MPSRDMVDARGWCGAGKGFPDTCALTHYHNPHLLHYFVGVKAKLYLLGRFTRSGYEVSRVSSVRLTVPKSDSNSK